MVLLRLLWLSRCFDGVLGTFSELSHLLCRMWQSIYLRQWRGYFSYFCYFCYILSISGCFQFFFQWWDNRSSVNGLFSQDLRIMDNRAKILHSWGLLFIVQSIIWNNFLLSIISHSGCFVKSFGFTHELLFVCLICRRVSIWKDNTVVRFTIVLIIIFISHLLFSKNDFRSASRRQLWLTFFINELFTTFYKCPRSRRCSITRRITTHIDWNYGQRSFRSAFYLFLLLLYRAVSAVYLLGNGGL